jgi:hypothetical protein
MPPGSALLQLVAVGAPQESGLRRLGLRLIGPENEGAKRLEAGYPRSSLQRLVLGPGVGLQPSKPLSGLDPLPPQLGGVKSLAVALEPAQTAPPWDGASAVVAGEENPARVARALNIWWADSNFDPPEAAVVWTDAAGSAARWSGAPSPGRSALLFLPEDGFPGRLAEVRRELQESWESGDVVGALPSRIDSDLVVLITGEAPGQLGARLRELAGSPAMEGKLLALWSLSGPVRQDLPASLLADGRLAGFGLAESTVISGREVIASVGDLDSAIAAAPPGSRIERLSTQLLWYF